MSNTSPSSLIDPAVVDEAVASALRKAALEWARDDIACPGEDDNLLEKIDSFAIVELLLLTEGEVEAVVGRYVPLADEKVLDAETSPLRRLKDWRAYVQQAVARG